MTTVSTRRGLSPELRAALFHFLVFGPTGVATVYFGIWLTHRGISANEIGLINAAPVLGMMLINLFVGRLADRAKDWKQAIVALALVAGVVPIGLFFVSGFWGILAVWTLCIVPGFSLSPLTDAATLRMTLRNGTDFASVRAWGTVGYMASVLLAGPVMATFGDAGFLPLFLLLCVLRAVMSLQLPRFRALPGEAVPGPSVPTASSLRQVLKPWFVLPLVGLGMHQSIHGILSAFAALLWKEQGVPDVVIGILIGLMAFSEATMMFLWKRLNIRNVSARHLIAFAIGVGALRWTAMAFSPPIWLLFFLQLLHSITYAIAYFSGLQFIANWTSEDIAAEAQGFAFMLQQGISVVALIGFGWLVTIGGAYAWFGAAGFAILGMALVVISLRMKQATTTAAA